MLFIHGTRLKSFSLRPCAVARSCVSFSGEKIVVTLYLT